MAERGHGRARSRCCPVYVWLLFTTTHELAAGFLLGTLGATDWVDGYLARRLGQVTTLGKVLDPIADRALVFTAVVTIAIHGAVPWWFAIATLAREVLVSVAVLAARVARRGADRRRVARQGGDVRAHDGVPAAADGPRSRGVADGPPRRRVADRVDRPRARVERDVRLRPNPRATALANGRHGRALG